MTESLEIIIEIGSCIELRFDARDETIEFFDMRTAQHSFVGYYSLEDLHRVVIRAV